MKKSILFILSILFGINSFSQNIAFTNESGDILPDTVVISADVSELEVTEALAIDGYVKNFTSSAINMAIKREIFNGQYVNDSVELDVWGNGNWKWYYPEDQLCWGTCVIYKIDDEEVTSDFFDIKENEEVDLHNVIHYKGYNLEGTTILKYSILNGDVVEDEVVFKFEITNINGVSVENAVLNDIDIYPNPCKGNLTIANLEDVKTITISNIIGQNIFVSQNVKSKVILDMSNLNNGVYFATIITNDNKVFTERIVKR